MNDIKIVIEGQPITKKNSSQIVNNAKTGRPYVVPSKAYRTYEKSAGWFITCGARLANISVPVNVKVLYYMPTKRRVDLVNLLEATNDILVKYGVLKDDDSTIVVSHDGSRVLYDKENPRAEITISFLDS